MGETRDAVVIGAGHNGLVAANLLADAGWDVLVCERAGTAGGAVRSARTTDPAFVSDLYSAFYPLAAASPVISGLGLADFGLRWSHAPVPLAHVLPDDRVAVLSRDLDETADGLESFAPGDGAVWRDLAAEWDVLGERVLGALLSPFPPLRHGAGLVRAAGVDGTLRLARLAALSVRRLGQERFRGAGGPILLAGNALHSDIPPDAAGSAVFGWLLCMLAQTVGFPVPVGGAGELTGALSRRLAHRGGELRTSCTVDAVLARGGSATGVRLADGTTVTARHGVLADVSAPQLYGTLLAADALPPAFVEQVERTFQWDTPTLKVDWALREPIPWSNPQAGRAGTVHLDGDLDDLSRYSTDLVTGTVPQRPFLLLGQMTRADPTRSPDGTESAWCYTHLPESVDVSTELLDEHVRRVEAVVERHAPGFSSRIAGRSVSSPAAIETGLGLGSVNGGTAQLHQQLVFRPTLGLGGADTPLDRLYLAGNAAHPGGGVHGACGANAARTALRRRGVLGVPRRAAVAAVQRRLYR